MLRGRRVVFFVGVLLFFLFFQTSTQAADIEVNDMVALSPVWKEAIKDNSIINLDTSTHQNLALFEVVTKGVGNIILPGETIQILLFKDRKFVSSQEQITNKQGIAKFTFVYIKEADYLAICRNIGHETPFSMKTLFFHSGLYSIDPLHQLKNWLPKQH